MIKKLTTISFLVAIIAGFLYSKKILEKNSHHFEIISLKWSLAPIPLKHNTLAEFTFLLKDKDHQPITDATVTTEATMTHPGMVPLFTTAQHLKEGWYKTQLIPSMPGDWILILTITRRSGEVIEKRLPFNVSPKVQQ